ncbi:MAG: arylsulfatase A [Kiritimatiellia bacterium]|jgi:arylsulfatase A
MKALAMKHLIKCITIILFSALAPLVAARNPNILFILVDDLGWHDLACQGNSAVKTPHIDRLAREGMRFTDAYAAAPVCSPTRAAIVTGKSPAALHITNHLPDRKGNTPKEAKWNPAECLDHLPTEHVTIAERLKAAGYANAFLGKWHLSGQGKGLPEFEPTNQGFDINIGGCSYGGPPTFFDPYKIPNLENRKTGEYLPDRLADEAISFMKDHREDPFMIFLWNYSVHWPMEAPEAYLKKYEGHQGPGLNDFRYGAMIEALDDSYGRIFAALDELDLAENTLIIFTSDNGGFAGVSDNRPLRAAKGHLYEGGIRVPLIVRWPGKIAAGSSSKVPVISMDYYPTILEAVGLPNSDTALEGESLMPLLTQSGDLNRTSIYFHYPNYAWHRGNRLGGAIRNARYKLIERYDNGELELFDMQDDWREKKNLAGDKPELAQRMQQELAAWRERIDAKMPRKR